MELILKIVMCVFFDAAVVMLFYTELKTADAEKKEFRIVAATFALGFVCNALSQIIFGGNVAVMLLLVLGFMLSYTVFVFTFSERREHDEKR